MDRHDCTERPRARHGDSASRLHQRLDDRRSKLHSRAGREMLGAANCHYLRANPARHSRPNAYLRSRQIRHGRMLQQNCCRNPRNPEAWKCRTRRIPTARIGKTALRLTTDRSCADEPFWRNPTLNHPLNLETFLSVWSTYRNRGKINLLCRSGTILPAKHC